MCARRCGVFFCLSLVCLFTLKRAHAQPASPPQLLAKPAARTAQVLTGAPTPTAAAARPLRVGVRAQAPWAFKDAKGGWDGVAVELWDQVAKHPHMEGHAWTLEEIEGQQGQTLTALKEQRVDVALVVNATVEAETQSALGPIFHVSHIGLVKKKEGKIFKTLKMFVSPTFLKIALGLCGLLLVIGALIWLAERREDEDDFQRAPREGLWSGFWWACVTMTTIGYGDKAPSTILGRVIAMTWMIAALGVTSSLTAAMTSASLGGSEPINVPQDLRDAELGIIKGSAATAYAERERLQPRVYDTPKQAMAALNDGTIKMIMGDDARLRHLKQSQWRGTGITVKVTQVPSMHAVFAMPEGGAVNESIRRAVLERITAESWEGVSSRYMAKPDE